MDIFLFNFYDLKKITGGDEGIRPILTSTIVSKERVIIGNLELMKMIKSSNYLEIFPPEKDEQFLKAHPAGTPLTPHHHRRGGHFYGP